MIIQNVLKFKKKKIKIAVVFNVSINEKKYTFQKKITIYY